MEVRFITKRKEFLDRDYFIKAAFGILSKSFGSKNSLDYVKKIRRNWRRKGFGR
jgi:DNA replication protein DnaD